MSQIRAHCEKCGAVHLAESDVTLRICRTDSSAQYRFRCPDCQRIQVKDCSRLIGDLLIRYDVNVEWFDLPSPEPAREFPPITLDDVLDAHLELEQM